MNLRSHLLSQVAFLGGISVKDDSLDVLHIIFLHEMQYSFQDLISVLLELLIRQDVSKSEQNLLVIIEELLSPCPQLDILVLLHDIGQVISILALIGDFGTLTLRCFLI